MIGNALDSTGRDVLFVKNGKVVGEGRSQIGVGNEYQGCGFISGELFEQLKTVAPFNDLIIPMKYLYARFSPYTGLYLGLQFTDPYPEAEALLEDVHAVDKFYFGYGMVPDFFKSVEGYGAQKDAYKEDIKCIMVFELKDWRSHKHYTQFVLEDVSRNDVSVERVMEWAKEFGMVEDPTKLNICYHFDSKDCVWLYHSKGNYHGIGDVETLEVSFGEHSSEVYSDAPEAKNGGWYSNNTQYFWPGYVEDAVETFVSRLRAEHPGYRFDHPKSEKLDIIKIRQTKKLEFESHYDYLDAMLEPFWKLVFDKTPDQMACAGIVIAHGDKAYSYKEDWKKKDIPFHRGVLLFLLTYTQLLGDTPKHQSCEWVINKYPEYLERIEQAERQVLKDRFGIIPRVRLKTTKE